MRAINYAKKNLPNSIMIMLLIDNFNPGPMNLFYYYRAKKLNK